MKKIMAICMTVTMFGVMAGQTFAADCTQTNCNIGFNTGCNQWYFGCGQGQMSDDEFWQQLMDKLNIECNLGQNNGQNDAENAPSTPQTPLDHPQDTPWYTPDNGASTPGATPDEEPDKNGHSDADDDDDDAAGYATQVAALVNAERAAAGLAPVTLDDELCAAAQTRAAEAAVSFSHTRPNGTSCFTALKEAGISYRGAGENIAYGQTSPAAVMDDWMASSGHRANILNSSYTKLGVGCTVVNGVTYWAQFFTY